MRMVTISDNSSVCAGFRLVGVESCLAETAEELADLLQANIKPEIGLIAVTSSLAKKGEKVLEKYNETDAPLVTIIPD